MDFESILHYEQAVTHRIFPFPLRYAPKVLSPSTVLSIFGSVEGLRDPVKPSQVG